MLKSLLLILALMIPTILLQAGQIIIDDRNEYEINIQQYPAEGDLLLIMLVDHEDEREMFENLLLDIQAAGIEIWLADLISDYFLPRTGETERTLSGKPVKLILQNALQNTDKIILLAGYDRMPLAVLRGIHLWQMDQPDTSRVAGSVLFYPNLFGAAPVAGEKPDFDPIVKVTNYPMVIYQPDTGSLRWRLDETLERLWQNNAPAMAYMVPQVRDWFFMGGMDHGKGDKAATQRIPAQLINFAEVLQSLPKPQKPIAAKLPEQNKMSIMELVKLKKPFSSPGFQLNTVEDTPLAWQDYAGKVTLVNFWASWCGPCVEEIPSLNQLGRSFNHNEFDIVSIDYRETIEEISAFTKRIPVDFPILMDFDGKTSLKWNVFSFPSSFLVDKKGIVRYSANRGIEWNTEEIHQTIKQLINE